MKKEIVKDDRRRSGSGKILFSKKRHVASGKTGTAEKPSRKLREVAANLKKAKDKLHVGEEKYRQLVENANSIIMCRNVKGKITFVNQFAQKFFGYTEKEIIGKNILGTIVPETDSFGRDFKKNVRDIGRQPELYATNVNEVIRRNGQRVCVAWANSPIYDERGNFAEVLCIGRDITEHKQMENELRLLAAIVRNSPDPITVQNFQGNIISWNHGAELVYGYSEAEALKMNICKIIPEHKRDEIAVLTEDLKKGKDIEIFSTQRLTKDGRLVDILLTIIPVMDEAGKPYAIATNERDITEQKRLEKEVLSITERERKLISREMHDSMGNILTGIAVKSKGLALNLKDKLSDESKGAAEISKLASKLITQMRRIIRTLYPVDIETGGIVPALQALAMNTQRLMGISCKFNCSEPVLINSHVEARQLYRIAQEAITNAVKHGKAKNIKVELTSDENTYILSVKNTGKNFPRVLKKKKGMGLRIMEHRAAMLGGDIDIRRADKGGTIVTCKFPKSPA